MIRDVTTGMSSRIFTSALLLMRYPLILLLLVPLATAHGSSSEPTPHWKTKVEQFGYDAAPRKMFAPVRLSVAFSDNGHVVISWIAPDASKDNKYLLAKEGDAAHAHVVVIDADTGRQQAKQEWATRFTYAAPALAGTTGGRFLLCTNDAVRVLSVTLEVVQEKHFASPSTCKPSPSGRTLLLSAVSQHTREMTLLDTESFNLQSNWTEQMPDGERTFAFSDRWLLGACGKPAGLCVRRVNEGWRPFRIAGQQRLITAAESITASFINDDTIGIGGTTLTLATVEGAVLFQVSPVDKQMFGTPPVPSSGGARFVVVEGRMRGARNDGLDMYPFYATDNATVYSVNNDRPVFSLKLQGTSPWTPWHAIQNVAALSPDGHSLAIISDGVLEVFEVTNGSEKQ